MLSGVLDFQDFLCWGPDGYISEAETYPNPFRGGAGNLQGFDEMPSAPFLTKFGDRVCLSEEEVHKSKAGFGLYKEGQSESAGGKR